MFLKRKSKRLIPPISTIKYPITIADAFGASRLPFCGDLTISGYGDMIALFTRYFLDYQGNYRWEYLEDNNISMASQNLLVGSINVFNCNSSWLSSNQEYRTAIFPIPNIANLIIPLGLNATASNFDRDGGGTYYQFIPPDNPTGDAQTFTFKIDFTTLTWIPAQPDAPPLVRFQLAINGVPTDNGGVSSVSSLLAQGGSVTYSYSIIRELNRFDQISFMVSNIAQAGNPPPQTMYIQSQSLSVIQLF